MASEYPTPPVKVKQPKELYIIFTTEMWERFGFYLMVGILTLYLTSHLHLTQGEAASLYGYYGASVYFAPLFGGIIADRWLGYRRCVILGAAFLSIGYGLLAFLSNRIHQVTPSLYISLLLLAVGNGLFKPNMSTLVGNLYPQGDPRRDAGFSIFYMSVNVGAILSPIIGFLAGRFGGEYAASWAFGAAAAGMFIAFINFTLRSHHLKAADQRSSLSAVLHVPLPKEYEDKRDSKEVERRRIAAIFIMALVAIFFWMVFQQNASTLNFFAQNHTDFTFGGHVPKEIFAGKDQDNSFAGVILQIVNPFFIVTLTFPVIAFFALLRKTWSAEPTTPAKMGIGMILTALSCLVMVFASLKGGNKGQVSPFWLIGSYFVVTIGELCLSPLGTSLVTKLAPRRMTSMMLGVWYFATAVGNLLAGKLGVLWERWPHHQFFILLTGSSLVAAAVLFVFLPFLKRALPKEQKI